MSLLLQWVNSILHVMSGFQVIAQSSVTRHSEKESPMLAMKLPFLN